ncbi:diacylglycerol/lipid kinase family protein [[Mycoplasma] anseris]|nr:diacylglycerol kinase family protein [[Mycoplasma] anseris]
MIFILYNSLSKTGKNIKKITRITNQAKKVFGNHETKIIDLISIKDTRGFVDKLHPNDDIAIIIGGDGTLTKVANQIHELSNLPKIYSYKAGTGNDFLRAISKHKETIILKKKFFFITPYLKKLPWIKFNNQKLFFLNGVGVGLDAVIALALNNLKKNKSPNSFFQSSINSVLKFKKLKRVEIELDGKPIIYHNVWFTSIMQGKYYGGGMKIAPYANRFSDQLELIIFKNMSKTRVACLFPLVYTGLHRFQKGVINLRGSHIKIKFSRPEWLQIDGETFPSILEVEIKKEKNLEKDS